MRAFKFMMVDLLKCRIQVVFMILFTALAYFFMARSVSPLNGMFYMSFAAVVVGIQPFMQEQSAEVGFLYMLPGSKNVRVAGRFLYGLLLQVFALILSLVDMMIYHSFFGKDIIGLPEGAILCFSVGLIFCALQYILFYLLGKIKSQQMAALIMMIPGFVMFFGISFFLESGMKYIQPYLPWMQAHTNTLYAALAAAGVMIWCLGILISGCIVRNRDDV